tara:strand:- start:121 stop:825 length:705 start_codon:yes stop_codon:yes gene_type:complete
MAKELPYFKFEPNQWENGNIQMLSREDKGLFIDLCSMYWSRLGDVPIKLAIQKLCNGNATAFNSLCDEHIIEVLEGNIFIKFLSEQLGEFEDISKQNSKNAKDRWEKYRKQKAECERIATASIPQCENDAIREDKSKEDKIIEDINTATPFSFFNSLINVGAEKQYANEWLKVRKNKKLTNTETAFKKFALQVEKSGYSINEVLEKCIEKSWGGFDAEWHTKQKVEKSKTKMVY